MENRILNKLIAPLMAVAILSSCHQEKPKPKSKHRYTLFKSDDDNWSTSGKIECDSFNFVTTSHVEFYVDGRKSNLKAGLIKVFTNDDFESKQ